MPPYQYCNTLFLLISHIYIFFFFSLLFLLGFQGMDFLQPLLSLVPTTLRLIFICSPDKLPFSVLSLKCSWNWSPQSPTVTFGDILLYASSIFLFLVELKRLIYHVRRTAIQWLVLCNLQRNLPLKLLKLLSQSHHSQQSLRYERLKHWYTTLFWKNYKWAWFFCCCWRCW